MTSLAQRFDAWVQRGPFTATDLGVCRVVVGTALLLVPPHVAATADLPAWTWDPPPGPLRLLDGPPGAPAVLALQVVLAVAAACVLVGWRTRAASIAAGLACLLAEGLVDSYGVINHFVLLGVVPLVLCWADWGQALSVDAARRRSMGSVPQWPVRLLALCVAVSFGTAAVPKILAGWLDPSTHAAQGHQLSTYVMEDRDHLLAPVAHAVTSPWVWEAADWATVAVELGVLVSVVSWTWFRRALVLAVAFHVGVLLTMNIAFTPDVIAYSAFVPWGALLVVRSVRVPSPSHPRLVVAALSVVGVVAALTIGPEARYALSAAYVLAAGAVVALLVTRRPSTTSSG